MAPGGIIADTEDHIRVERTNRSGSGCLQRVVHSFTYAAPAKKRQLPTYGRVAGALRFKPTQQTPKAYLS